MLRFLINITHCINHVSSHRANRARLKVRFLGSSETSWKKKVLNMGYTVSLLPQMHL